MITYVVGDLFTSPAKVLVNTVNTVGVMGKGIAKEFKSVYPEMFEEYQYYCEAGLFEVGQLWLYKTSHKWILNFPTKKHWRNKSKVEYIEAGLQKFADTYDSKGLLSVSFPMLGCGNGELDWEADVQPLMEEYLRPLPIDIYVHLYQPGARFVPEHRDIREIKRWLRGEPRHLPFTEFWEDIQRLANTGAEYESLDRSAMFSVEMDLFGSCLRFKTGLEAFVVSKDDFAQLWSVLRHEGYHLVYDLQCMTEHAQILSGFLQHIHYISPVMISALARAPAQDIGLLRRSLASDRKTEQLRLKSAS